MLRKLKSNDAKYRLNLLLSFMPNSEYCFLLEIQEKVYLQVFLERN